MVNSPPLVINPPEKRKDDPVNSILATNSPTISSIHPKLFVANQSPTTE